MVGWCISIGSGAIAGLVIGVIYRLLNDSFEEPINFFNDGTLYEYPKVGGPNQNENRVQAPAPESGKEL